MPHSPHTAPSLAVRLLRAAASLLALTALVAGVPLLLLVAGSLPSHVPSPGEIGTALTAPDDGSELFTVLTLAAWTLWAWFSCATLVEALAMVRHRPTLQVRGFGAPQRLAAFLLGGLLILPAGTAMAASTPAAAATAAHLPQQTAAPAGISATTTQQSTSASVVYVVNDTAETVWSIAENALGDGQRFAEIRELNPDLPKTTILAQGTVVRLPADARITGPGATTASGTNDTTAQLAGSRPVEGEDTLSPDSADASQTASVDGNEQGAKREYTVAPGDNLTEIAHEQLGDASRWSQLFEANKGEQQPYGHHFTDPNLIYPGQQITLPADTMDRVQPDQPDHLQDPRTDQEQDRADGSSPDQDEAAEATEDNGTSPGAGASAHPETASPTPSATTPPASRTPAAESATPDSPATSSPSTAASSPEAAGPTATSPATGQTKGQGQQAGVLGLVATGVLAAGFLSFLGYRRIVQLRQRRRGHHIALPAGDAARVEHALSVSETVIDSAVLEPILRTMAVHLTDADRELPEVAAIVLGDRDVVVHLAQPATPVPPFTAAPDELTRWSCPTNAGEVLPPEETGDVDEPYPALVSLGWDLEGRLVLVDLEYVGHLHLAGPAAGAVLRTLALELATSEFTHHLDLTLIGETLAPGLADEVGERVTQRAGLGEAAAAMRARHSDQQRALSLLGAATLRHARTGVDTAAAWTPSLVVACAPEYGDADGIADLLQVAADQPRSATAVLTTGSLPADAPGSTAWTLHADPEAGPVRLPIDGVDIDCTLQALSDEHYACALEILAVSRADDVPAPQPAFPVVDHTPLRADDTVDEDDELPVAVVPVTGTTATAGPDRVPNLLAHFASFDEDDHKDGDDGSAAGNDTGPDDREQSDDSLSDEHAAADAPAAEADRPGEPGTVALDKADRPVLAAPREVPAQQAPVRSVSIRLPDDVLAAPVPADLSPATAGAGELELHPVVRVLGPVDVVGVRGTLTEKKRQRTYTELAAWLILHPGHHPNALDHRALDEALWPDRDEVSLKYRNAVVSRTRTWLGRDSDDQPYVPLLKTANSRYSISPAVGCDWHDFQRLTQAGKDLRTPNADLALRQALELVRGRPFGSTDRRRYKWAEHLALVMTMEIVDAAEILAERRLADHDPRGALWAATKGLEVAPAVESLHRILFQAYAAIGDYEALERSATWLEEFTENNDLELDDETLAVLDQLRAKA